MIARVHELLRLVLLLCVHLGFNAFVQRKPNLHIHNVSSLHPDHEKLSELLQLLQCEFDLNHAAGASTTVAGSATKTGSTCGSIGGTIITGGSHGSGGAMTGGLIWFLICAVTFASMAA
jgi:hypothetical protein